MLFVRTALIGCMVVMLVGCRDDSPQSQSESQWNFFGPQDNTDTKFYLARDTPYYENDAGVSYSTQRKTNDRLEVFVVSTKNTPEDRKAAWECLARHFQSGIPNSLAKLPKSLYCRFQSATTYILVSPKGNFSEEEFMWVDASYLKAVPNANF